MNKPKITVRREGGIWHGYLEGRPEVDERGLTEEMVRRKVEQLAAARRARLPDDESGGSVSRGG